MREPLKETVYSLDVQTLGLRGVLHLHVPSFENDATESTAFADSRSPRHKQASGFGPRNEVETAYANTVIARNSGIFAPPVKSACPIFWKILRNQSVQLFSVAPDSISEDTSGAAYSVCIHFPADVLDHGITFAHNAHTSETSLFVLTTARVLYSITLPADAFMRTAENWPRSWCRISRPASFVVRSPMALTCSNEQNLYVAWQEGGFVRLVYDEQVDGYVDNVHFSHNGYLSSLKQLLSLQALRSDYVPPNRVLCLRCSATHNVLFVLTADMNLRVYSTITNALLKTLPIVCDNAPKAYFHAFLALDTVSNNFLAIYCPYVAWGAILLLRIETNADNHFLGLSPLTPSPIQAPIPDDKAFVPWIVTGLCVHTNSRDSLVITTAWKSNLSCLIQCADVKLGHKVKVSWRPVANSLDAADDDFFDIPSSMASGDVSEIWLQRIFFQKALSSSALEVALLIYTGQNSAADLNNPTLSFDDMGRQELGAKIVHAVVGNVQLEAEQQAMNYDYDGYRERLYNEWDRFYKLVLFMDNYGKEVYDIVYLPGISALAAAHANKIGLLGLALLPDSICAGVENTNTSVTAAEPIIKLSLLLHDALSDSALSESRFALRELTQQEMTYSVGDSIWTFYDKYLSQSLSTEMTYALVDTMLSMKDPVNTISRLIRTIKSGDFERSDGTPSFLTSLLISRSLLDSFHAVNTIVESLLFLLFVAASQESKELQSTLVGCDNLCLELLTDWSVINFYIDASRLLMEPTAEESADSTIMADTSADKIDSLKTRCTTAFEFFVSLINTDFYCNCEKPETDLYSVLIQVCYRQLFCSSRRHILVIELMSQLLLQGQASLSRQLIGWLKTSAVEMYLKGHTYLNCLEPDKAVASFRRAFIPVDELADFSSAFFVDYQDLAALYPQEPLACYYLHISMCLMNAACFRHAVTFCELAISSLTESNKAMETDIYYRMFKSACAAGLFKTAYMAIMQVPSRQLPREFLAELLSSMADAGCVDQILNFPMPGLQKTFDDILQAKALNTVDVTLRPSWYHVLFAWRMNQGNMRGAAAILFERLVRFQSQMIVSQRSQYAQLLEDYLVVLNILRTLPKNDAWFLASRVDSARNKCVVPQRLVTLEDVEKGYSKALQSLATLVSSQSDNVQVDEQVPAGLTS
ncbi:nucleoporin Nup120 [Schizosaccharomyces japonicus yFS275]|uniref:Nucleoporin Nup120 n=1 Tax=Schizosaccharomyces japonicus (strain yFS275 / FY16936) TaxID=402676 RepID=B6K5P1_SCHJY|nr:nucleoporin Nup120 [Schizosaccharomyces japonicus yFS275]EEB08845.1 nucleoporin Nup120 [Schizosaccharomyces japonicus yFS275]